MNTNFYRLTNVQHPRHPQVSTNKNNSQNKTRISKSHLFPLSTSYLLLSLIASRSSGSSSTQNTINWATSCPQISIICSDRKISFSTDWKKHSNACNYMDALASTQCESLDQDTNKTHALGNNNFNWTSCNTHCDSFNSQLIDDVYVYFNYQPTLAPSAQPSSLPSSVPTPQPSSLPSSVPTSVPTPQPTVLHTESSLSTLSPSPQPTVPHTESIGPPSGVNTQSSSRASVESSDESTIIWAYSLGIVGIVGIKGLLLGCTHCKHSNTHDDTPNQQPDLETGLAIAAGAGGGGGGGASAFFTSFTFWSLINYYRSWRSVINPGAFSAAFHTAAVLGTAAAAAAAAAGGPADGPASDALYTAPVDGTAAAAGPAGGPASDDDADSADGTADGPASADDDAAVADDGGGAAAAASASASDDDDYYEAASDDDNDEFFDPA